MTIPSAVNLNLGVAYANTLLDSNGVGMGFTHLMDTIAADGLDSSKLTVNTTTNVLEVLPYPGVFSSGTVRNVVGVRKDTTKSFEIYTKIPLAVLRTYPLTSSYNNTSLGIVIGNDMNKLLTYSLDITLLSGTTYRWGVQLQTKTTAASTPTTQGGTVTLTTNVADTNNAFIEMWLSYNSITDQWSISYKFSNETKVTLARNFTMSADYKAALINTDIFAGMFFRRNNNGSTTLKMEADQFQVNYLETEITGLSQSQRATLSASGKIYYALSTTGAVSAQRSTLSNSSIGIKSNLTLGGTVAAQRATLTGNLAADEPNNFTVPNNKTLSLGTAYPGTILDTNGVGTGFTNVIPSGNQQSSLLLVNGVNGLQVTPDSGLVGSATLKNILALPVDASTSFTVKTTITLADLRLYSQSDSNNNNTLSGLAHTNGDFTYVIRANFEIAQIGNIYKWVLKLSGKIPSNSNAFVITYDVGTLITDTSSTSVELTLSYNPFTNNYSATYKADNKTRVTYSNFRQLDSTQITNMTGQGNSYVALMTKKGTSVNAQGFAIRYKEFALTYNAIQFKGSPQAQAAKTLSFLAINTILLTGTVAAQRATTTGVLNRTFIIQAEGAVKSRDSTLTNSQINQGVALFGDITSSSATLTGVLAPSGGVEITGTVSSRRATLSTAFFTIGKTIGGTVQAQSAKTTIALTFSDSFKSVFAPLSSRQAKVSGSLGIKGNLSVAGTLKAQSSNVVNVDIPFNNLYNFRVKSFITAIIGAQADRSTVQDATDTPTLNVKSTLLLNALIQSGLPTLSALLSVSPIILDFTQEAKIIVTNQTPSAVLFFTQPQSGVDITEASGQITS